MGISLKGVEISQTRLLLVEGDDDEKFINSFLRFEKIIDVQVICAKGKDSFADSILTTVKLPNFSRVEKYGVIRDADENYSASFKSVKDSLEESKLTPPIDTKSLAAGNPQVGIFIMPSNGQNGTLEDLCLQSVQSTPTMVCVDQFVQCVKKLPNPPKNPAKSKAKAYLSAMPESVPHVGVGAERGYWNFSAPAMNDLREFLNLFR